MDSIDQQIENAAKNYRDRPTKESYTLLCAFVNIKNEAKWTNGDYSDELDPISQKMRQIEIEYGLKSDESFNIHHAPEKWLELDKQYNQIINKKLGELFLSLGFQEISEEINNNFEEFHTKFEKYNVHLQESSKLIKKGTSLIHQIADELTVILNQNGLELSTYMLLTHGIEAAVCLIMYKSYISFIYEFDTRVENDENYKNKKPHRLSIGDLLDILMTLPQSPFNQFEKSHKDQIREYLSCIRNDYHHPWRYIHKEITPNKEEILNLIKAFKELAQCSGISIS
ncbi:TPA: hypothetical protein ACT97N_002297 [Legionella pneumophila]|uniref:hypothetical protein n=1 Tax=Legionella pneumophila TaxID=446 RepID=UPI001F4D9B69|nr:hypothetical protein [Legionella pneumophila]MCH9103664.1 hypothetical protein [Legionella pneumophila serogroup 1]